MNLELIQTKDGSPTVRNNELNATYHSIFGAVRESEHIFIQNGLHEAIKKSGQRQNILEVGFGTGLNALLTYRKAKEHKLFVNYVSIEKYPLPLDFVEQLTYPEITGSIKREEFLKMHHCDWGVSQRLIPEFTLTKYHIDFLQFTVPENIHLVYFDAFAPGVNPELWEKEVFEHLYQSMTKGGILVTFCAKGEIKRRLKQTGFTVETLPGPPGKREMVRANKT